jgi:hypothetical protein
VSDFYSKLEPNRPIPLWDDEARRWLQEQLETLKDEVESCVRTVASSVVVVATTGVVQELLDSNFIESVAFGAGAIVRVRAAGSFAASVASKQVELDCNGGTFLSPAITDPTDNRWHIDATIIGTHMVGTWYTEYGAQAFAATLGSDPVTAGLQINVNGQSATIGELTLDLFIVDFQRRTV